MADQVPTSTGVFPGLPPVEISDRALARFTIEMVGRLHDFEERFAEPRIHPKLNDGIARGANRRPR